MFDNLSYRLNAIFKKLKGHGKLTEQKIEEGLRESTELYTKLLATIPDVVVRTDLDGTILFINDVAIEISGYRRSEIEGQNMLNFVAPEDHAELEARMCKSA